MLQRVESLPKSNQRAYGGVAYEPPLNPVALSLPQIIHDSGRAISSPRQFDLLRAPKSPDVTIFAAGDLTLLRHKAVSIVGTREVSDDGAKRASRLARELVESGVVVMSGLAKGVDYHAHSSAIENGGRTVAVIGTPLDKAYPVENSELQETIYRNHLLISPFSATDPVFRSNFPKRNRVMALLSDATVIVEASDSSGTLHQAAECQRQGRWLFILKSVVDNPALTWPARFIGKPFVQVLTSTTDILERIGA